jgi:hypothetical protein
MFGIQLVGIFFALIMIYFTYLYYKREQYELRGLVVWMVIWIGFIVLVMFPSTIYGIMDTLSIGRTIDFFVIGGFFFFSGIIFYLYLIVKKMEKRVEKLVRKIAIEDKKKKL